MRSTRHLTLLGLVLGAAGIAGLWAAGIDFPVAVPPGLVLLGGGALLVGLLRRPWTAALGAFLGLFVVVGFLLSPTGTENLSGDAGPAVATAQAVQLVGVLLALVSGTAAAVRERRAADRDQRAGRPSAP